jgi:hypothetical protein
VRAAGVATCNWRSDQAEFPVAVWADQRRRYCRLGMPLAQVYRAPRCDDAGDAPQRHPQLRMSPAPAGPLRAPPSRPRTRADPLRTGTRTRAAGRLSCRRPAIAATPGVGSTQATTGWRVTGNSSFRDGCPLGPLEPHVRGSASSHKHRPACGHLAWRSAKHHYASDFPTVPEPSLGIVGTVPDPSYGLVKVLASHNATRGHVHGSVHDQPPDT